MGSVSSIFVIPGDRATFLHTIVFVFFRIGVLNSPLLNNLDAPGNIQCAPCILVTLGADINDLVSKEVHTTSGSALTGRHDMS